MTSQAHIEKYDALCMKHGVAWNKNSPRLVGETLGSLHRKYIEDEHLNNVPLRRWDMLAAAFLALHRGTGLSLAEAVCMQKNAARQLLENTALESTDA